MARHWCRTRRRRRAGNIGQEPLHQGVQCLRFKGLGQIAGDAYALAMRLVIGGEIAGQQKDRDMCKPRHAPECLTELKAVHPWHGGISQHDVWHYGLELDKTLLDIVGNDNLKSFRNERSLHDLLDGQTILNQQ